MGRMGSNTILLDHASSMLDCFRIYKTLYLLQGAIHPRAKKPGDFWHVIKIGKMQQAGLAAIESAKQEGRWDATYDYPAASKGQKLH